MADWTITVQENTTRRVVIKADTTNTPAATYITWANLSPLFDQPDAPGGVTGSITGERTNSKTSLRLVSISHEHNATSKKTTNLNWVDNGGSPVHCWPISSEATSIDFPVPVSWPTGTDPHATNALQIEAVTLGATDSYSITLEFSAG